MTTVVKLVDTDIMGRLRSEARRFALRWLYVVEEHDQSISGSCWVDLREERQSVRLRKHRIDDARSIVCVFAIGLSKSRCTFAKLGFGAEHIILALHLSHIWLNGKYFNDNVMKCLNNDCLLLRCRTEALSLVLLLQHLTWLANLHIQAPIVMAVSSSTDAISAKSSKTFTSQSIPLSTYTTARWVVICQPCIWTRLAKIFIKDSFLTTLTTTESCHMICSSSVNHLWRIS